MNAHDADECGANMAWHGEFPKRPAAGMLVDQDGYLWGSEESIPRHYTIVGSVSAAKGEMK